MLPYDTGLKHEIFKPCSRYMEMVPRDHVIYVIKHLHGGSRDVTLRPLLDGDRWQRVLAVIARLAATSLVRACRHVTRQRPNLPTV